jgi:hypothetical protein
LAAAGQLVGWDSGFFCSAALLLMLLDGFLFYFFFLVRPAAGYYRYVVSPIPHAQAYTRAKRKSPL